MTILSFLCVLLKVHLCESLQATVQLLQHFYSFYVLRHLLTLSQTLPTVIFPLLTFFVTVIFF